MAVSVEQIGLVWKHEFSHSEQSIMLALADHAHDDGTEIRPGISRLAWKTGYSERQVQRILGRLRDERKILVLTRRGDGRGKPNVYKFDWTKGVKKSPFRPPKPEEIKGDISDQKGDISEIKGDISGQKGDIAASPEPSLEPSLEPSVSTDSSASAEKEGGQIIEFPKVNPIPLNQFYVTQFYDQLKEKHGVSLRENQFGFHLTQMDRMLKQYEPTDEEIERVIARMVDKFPAQPKIDALSAIQDVRLGRDTGEAWDGPAPWEQLNPHSEEGEAAKNKPRPAVWYESFSEREVSYWEKRIADGATHDELMEEL